MACLALALTFASLGILEPAFRRYPIVIYGSVIIELFFGLLGVSGVWARPEMWNGRDENSAWALITILRGSEKAFVVFSFCAALAVFAVAVLTREGVGIPNLSKIAIVSAGVVIGLGLGFVSLRSAWARGQDFI